MSGKDSFSLHKKRLVSCWKKWIFVSCKQTMLTWINMVCALSNSISPVSMKNKLLWVKPPISMLVETPTCYCPNMFSSSLSEKNDNGHNMF